MFSCSVCIFAGILVITYESYVDCGEALLDTACGTQGGDAFTYACQLDVRTNVVVNFCVKPRDVCSDIEFMPGKCAVRDFPWH